MSKKTATSRAYEVTYILGERSTPSTASQKLTDLSTAITGLGGEIEKSELWGRRELAYEIKHNRSGFYTTIWFKLPPQELKTLQHQLRFDESIIRSLVTEQYTSAQPGTLFPVVAEEKEKKNGKDKKEEDKSSAEEMLRRTTAPAAASKEEEELEIIDDLPEEERLKKLDEKLDELLQEEVVS